MPSITIYTTPTCPYCIAAKALLQKKGAQYVEISVEGDRALLEVLRERTGRHTVPQIYIGEHHVGGYDDLKALENADRLDSMLAYETPAQERRPMAATAEARASVVRIGSRSDYATIVFRLKQALTSFGTTAFADLIGGRRRRKQE